MNTTIKAAPLPLPDFFDPSKVAEIWRVPYALRMEQAQSAARRLGITPAASDRVKIGFMPIDVQLTFCHPQAALFVGGRSGRGALDDTVRTAEFIYRNARALTRVIPTMDTHTAFQIFHPVFWVNEKGEHPAPFTMITLDDVESGRWQVNPAMAWSVLGDAAKFGYLSQFGLHYVRQLTKGGKYPLMVWPYHAMLGDIDHALVPLLQEAVFYHSMLRSSQTDYRIKGGNPLTENYSVLRPEVLIDQRGEAIAQKNSRFIEALLTYDHLVIGGQAKSHCVAWAIEDLLTDINARDPELAKKVYLVEDLSSPVVTPVHDFTDDADKAFERFAAAGMHVVRSTDPIESWPGISF
ncbi:MAG: isochorismatase [Oligoflexia bacterium]|nr:isochorismatase [Oligoflexia bacterium]